MPCSRSGQSYPLPAPPQAFMKLPTASNTTIAGAAFPESSGLSVRGRCRSQTLSCASMAKLDASPSLNCGVTSGHAGSTPNTGTLRACACGDCAAALVVTSHAAGAPAAMRYATTPMRPRVLRFTTSSCQILSDALRPFARQAYLAGILTGGLIDLNRTGVVYSIASSALPPSSPNVKAELALVEPHWKAKSAMNALGNLRAPGCLQLSKSGH